MLIGSFVFANEKDVVTSVELENVVELESVLYCTTETYTHTKTLTTFSMYYGYDTVITMTYTSGGCTRCYGSGSFTLDCWGRTF